MRASRSCFSGRLRKNYVGTPERRWPCVWTIIDYFRRMLKKARLLTRPTLARRDAPSPKQSRSSETNPRFTVFGSDARTPLADFFSILRRTCAKNQRQKLKQCGVRGEGHAAMVFH